MHGVRCLGDGRCRFRLWAPLRDEVLLRILTPEDRLIPMERKAMGYWEAEMGNVPPGSTYLYRLDKGLERPDPASGFQPQGVHGPSCVVDHGAFPWHDGDWKGLPLEEMILYELHVGTFTQEGTFDAAAVRLDDLVSLGVNALELMPVAQFSGRRNWGYDGVYPFAVQNSYGGPEGLKWFVDSCHRRGIAVILDVVYNHLGPEGNYLGDFAPFFTDRYRTGWGEAVNFDGPYSYGVRRYFVENALGWFRDYHMDGLRLDAIHALFDMSPRHFLRELSEEVERLSLPLGRSLVLIAENDRSDVRSVLSPDRGGYGLHAQWCEDFHHTLHALLTGERTGYYADYGKSDQLERTFRQGHVYSGQFSEYRKRFHGASTEGLKPGQFVAFMQNHDQVGNRMNGERLSRLVCFERLKLAAGALLVSPYVPLLFMGEEYGEEAPFLYFVNHIDPDLAEAVRVGRRREFVRFRWQGTPPDPQAEETFLRSKLRWKDREEGTHGVLLAFYRKLIRLRKTLPPLSDLDWRSQMVERPDKENVLVCRRWSGEDQVLCLMNFGDSETKCRPSTDGKKWERLLDSAEESWLGPGSSLPERVEGEGELSLSPFSFSLYRGLS